VSVAFDRFSRSEEAKNESLWALAQEIDKVTGSERWTVGNSETVPSLKSENWNFHSQEAANLSIVPGVVARSGNISILREVLAEGVPVTDSASIFGCVAIEYAVERRSTESIVELLARRAPPQWRLTANESPAFGRRKCDVLSVAASLGSTDIVDLILRNKADPNWVDNDGMTTALSLAARQSGDCSRGDFVGVTRLLIAAGADVNGLNGATSKPIFEVRCPDVARVLITRGASLAPLSNGRTPLIFATSGYAQRANSDLVRIFLDAGVDVNAQDRDGETALMQQSVTPEVARILVSAGANINALNARNQTALSKTRSLELTRVLLELGADPRMPFGSLHPLLQASCTPDQRRQAAGGGPIALQDERCNLLMAWIAQHPN
jgi:ankyrin repeat protein